VVPVGGGGAAAVEGRGVRRACWFAGLPDAGPCDGRLVRCHLIRRQVLRRELNAPPAVVDDPRCWVWGCGGPTGAAGHHGALDTARTLRVPRDRLPAAFVEFVEELWLGWWAEREYPE
jgi:hypothetical protein